MPYQKVGKISNFITGDSSTDMTISTDHDYCRPRGGLVLMACQTLPELQVLDVSYEEACCRDSCSLDSLFSAGP